MPWICKKTFQCWNRALTDSLHKIVFPFNLINVLNNLIASHSQQLSTMLYCTYKHLVNHCRQQLLITVVGTLSMSAFVPTTLKQIYYCCRWIQHVLLNLDNNIVQALSRDQRCINLIIFWELMLMMGEENSVFLHVHLTLISVSSIHFNLTFYRLLINFIVWDLISMRPKLPLSISMLTKFQPGPHNGRWNRKDQTQVPQGIACYYFRKDRFRPVRFVAIFCCEWVK